MSRVLIVDDSETILHFLRMILESEHYEVDTASDGVEGFAKAQQSLPDVIITDSMPEADRQKLEEKGVQVIIAE